MKLHNIFLECYNFFRLLFLNSLGKKIECGWRQLIHPRTEIEIKNGKIILGGPLQTEKGVFLSAKGGSISIGSAYINRNVLIVSRSSIHIGHGVSIGPNTVIYDHDHDKNTPGALTCSPVSIEDNVWIGSCCVILKGVIIGANSIIGAGTIITKDIPENSIVTTKISYRITQKN